MKNFCHLLIILSICTANAQKGYWQQHVDYKMNIKVDVKTYQYDAEQVISYKNNSPDTLKNVFYHLYLNAFQPNSEMDIRLQTIADPDRRMVVNTGTEDQPIIKSKISLLKKEEQGFFTILSLHQDGKPVSYEVVGTVLKVTLNKPILPNKKSVFSMKYKAQIPEMVRRSGRNSADNVALSMAQWYPKMAEYDTNGWHTNQYIMREFHGVWGNFDVKIQIDKNYIVAATGELQNPKEIGFGYLPEGQKVIEPEGNTRVWHFKAKNVHDFTWAADPDYKHDIKITTNGKKLHFFYKKYQENWQKLQSEMVKVFDFFQEKIGEYPWSTYSFIQAGDGGMEYAMCTLVAGGNNYNSLLKTSIHELGHTWFQHIFASDELTYPWMDEGFTSYIQDWAYADVIRGEKDASAWQDAYQCYFSLIEKNIQEVATTHADRYELNSVYSATAYCKGAVFLSQLGYIIGQEALQRTFKRFYKDFAMKHCTPQNFVRTAEKVSGMQLMWYLNEFMQTDHTIDYAIDNVQSEGSKTKITLKRIGRMPISLDILVIPNGERPFSLYVPTELTFGQKPNPFKNMRREELSPWGWAYPTYTFVIDLPLSQIKTISLDPQELSTDTNLENNNYTN